MKSIIVTVVLTLLVAGCGGGSKKATVYALGPTKDCARGIGHILPRKADDFVASTASGGAFRLKLSDNEATVLFGANPEDALGLANGYRRFHAKNVGIEDILRTQSNVVVLWKVHPSDTDAAMLTHCLK